MIQDVRGDEIVAVFESEAGNAVRAGLGMLRSLREHNRERVAHGSEELQAGIGLNTGAVGIGLVGGVNRMVLTIIGDAVNLAARIESTNKRYGSALLISDADVPRGLQTRKQFDIRRMERVMVVNRRKPVTIYEVYDEDPTTSAPRSGPRSPLSTRPLRCLTPAMSTGRAPLSSDASSYCPAIRSPRCIWRTATRWREARCRLARKSRFRRNSECVSLLHLTNSCKLLGAR